MKKLFLFFLLFFPTSLLSTDWDDDIDILMGLGGEDVVDLAEKIKASDLKSSREWRLDAIKLWGKTGGYRSRDPLYLMPQRKLSCDKSGLSCNFFFNRSSSLPVRPNTVLQTDGINLLLGFIDGGVVPLGDQQDTESLMKIFPYLDDMTIQEHRVGGFFQFLFNYKKWVMHVDLPVFLSEKNFWVRDRRLRQDLLDVLSESANGSGGAVRTRFGLGDTRLRLGYKLRDSDRLKIVSGVEGILPTSRWGRKHPKNIIKTEAGSTRKQLLEDLLNVSKHIMLDPKLGTGHWGIGGFFDMRFSIIPDKFDLWMRFSYSHLLSQNEDRFMPTPLLMPVGDLGLLFTSDVVPADVSLTPLFPQLVTAKVSPGDIFNATLGFDWKFAKNWKLGVGYDYYNQQREEISSIFAPDIDDSLIIVGDAIASKIVQHKIFGDISYTKKGKKIDWNFGIGGDTTFSSRGAGRDWTLFAKIGISF